VTDNENSISILGRWAFSVSAPTAINEACILLTLHYNRLGDQSEDNAMPDDIQRLLMPFMRL
jgi:hypothetical protein